MFWYQYSIGISALQAPMGVISRIKIFDSEISPKDKERRQDKFLASNYVTANRPDRQVMLVGRTGAG